MTDIITTIRLPPSLLSELNELAKEQHYIDLSELIRGVLRKRFEESANGNSKALSDSILNDIKKHAIVRSEARLSEELTRISRRLREELK